jgi:hypothetical protein
MEYLPVESIQARINLLIRKRSMVVATPAFQPRCQLFQWMEMDGQKDHSLITATHMQRKFSSDN